MVVFRSLWVKLYNLFDVKKSPVLFFTSSSSVLSGSVAAMVARLTPDKKVAVHFRGHQLHFSTISETFSESNRVLQHTFPCYLEIGFVV